MSPNRRLVLIPTYNEAGNIHEMADRLRALGLDMLFVDDASPDGTGRVLDGLAAKDHTIRVLHRPCKQGVGSAHLDGIAFAYERGYSVLITMDADFTHPPEAVPALLAGTEGVDLVVGSRFVENGAFVGWSLWRKMLSVAGHWTTGRLLGMPYDATGAFRAYRLDRIPRDLFSRVRSSGYAFFFESLFVLSRGGVAIREVPVRAERRRRGRSKMNFRDMAASLGTAVRLLADSRWPRSLSRAGRRRHEGV